MTELPHPARASDGLVIDSLTKRFGSVTAVDGVSLTARRGEVTAILGPNGAGKSTTIACATGLLAPDSGTIRALGADPLRTTADGRARIGVMLQDGGLSTSAKPRQLLAYAARMVQQPRDADALARQLGIDQFASTIVRRLSGGQKQRLSLALALIAQPDLLFLDEPTAGMDAAIRRRTRDIIRAEADRGAAVILTTHAIDDVEALADHVVVIAGGRILASGSTADVVSQLQDSAPTRTALTLGGGTDEDRAAFTEQMHRAAVEKGLTLEAAPASDALEDILVQLTNDTEEARA
ncbi:ABC transporter ATP-binding protein [Helcobacillus massiliensis]|uniref:ABC transporter ATP-binding protein n=1 Tax=Helcobacillus massiliensis TaxID=521392 RepID=UPI0021A6300E|nr:ABC transporter ATP-binding protein [Helcobacillus massiliensis]MCT1556949.1 ABC transporter ATP-binding protein [Helcobacillus massiliensis]MCT2035338.1 ABC transporter ATP-binding protein [Helcobacillus massiliensis]MCT2331447.1 ABC transporter ATP-binding protein [Helcobacillus massiliensis]